jgi:hypothetical protein
MTAKSGWYPGLRPLIQALPGPRSGSPLATQKTPQAVRETPAKPVGAPLLGAMQEAGGDAKALRWPVASRMV